MAKRATKKAARTVDPRLPHKYTDEGLAEAAAKRKHQPSGIKVTGDAHDRMIDARAAACDGDLQPWDKNGVSKQPLAGLYDSAAIWVYGDFAMQSPERPETFPANWPPTAENS